MSAVYCHGSAIGGKTLHMCGFHLGHPDAARTEAKGLLGLVAGGKEPNTRNPRRRLWRCDATLLWPFENPR